MSRGTMGNNREAANFYGVQERNEGPQMLDDDLSESVRPELPRRATSQLKFGTCFTGLPSQLHLLLNKIPQSGYREKKALAT